jgi:hypothetical protein
MADEEAPTIGPATPQGWKVVTRADRAVRDFPLYDQVAAAAWTVGGRAPLPAREGSAAFERTCDEGLACLRQQIVALPFGKAH